MADGVGWTGPRRGARRAAGAAPELRRVLEREAALERAGQVHMRALPVLDERAGGLPGPAARPPCQPARLEACRPHRRPAAVSAAEIVFFLSFPRPDFSEF